jgi:hypothetical protein
MKRLDQDHLSSNYSKGPRTDMSRPGIESVNYEPVALDYTIYHDSHHLFPNDHIQNIVVALCNC